MTSLARLVDGLNTLGYAISPEQLAMFEVYRDELLRWNQHTNLTSITDPAEIETRHFLDSLTILQTVDGNTVQRGELKVLDVGAGAGFPGIPLKLILGDASLVLLESTGKKAAFLNHLVDLLGLADTTVVHDRAEVLAHHPAHRECYNLVVARAVAPLAVLTELCLPFTTVGGLFVAPKKGAINTEIAGARNAIRRVGGGDVHLIGVRLPQLADDRTLVCIRKESPSPDRYPRRSGMPLKRPL